MFASNTFFPFTQLEKLLWKTFEQ